MARNWTTIAAKRWKGRLVSGGGAAFRHPRMWFYQFPLWNCCGRLTPFAFNYSHHFNRSLNLGHATSLSSSRQSICLVATWLRPTRRVIQPIRLVNFIRQKIQKKEAQVGRMQFYWGPRTPCDLLSLSFTDRTNEWKVMTFQRHYGRREQRALMGQKNGRPELRVTGRNSRRIRSSKTNNKRAVGRRGLLFLSK